MRRMDKEGMGKLVRMIECGDDETTGLSTLSLTNRQ